MRIYDIISKKRCGNKLTREELEFFINGYLDGSITDYQASALLMAICINSMDIDEITNLTELMLNSGEVLNFDKVSGFLVDKHSTGGVGDKTTLVVVPIVAAAGVKVAKMSGRGLGHTGGTIDKLEAIKGYNTSLDIESIIENVNSIGAVIVGQTGNLAPADKKLYALRDATATVESIPLIASSIMSKKLATNPDGIVLEVTVGSGAFMKNVEEAKKLAQIMIEIGKKFNKKVSAYITQMDVPLGYNIGNNIEIEEAIEVLSGNGNKELTNVCIELAAAMIAMSKKISVEDSRKIALDMLNSGNALKKFVEIVRNQGGKITDDAHIDFEKPKNRLDIFADKDGYISKLDALEIGKLSVILGAGREKKEDSIDMTAGIKLNKQYGEYIKKGEIIFSLYSDKPISNIDNIDNIVEISDNKPDNIEEIIDRLGYGFE